MRYTYVILFIASYSMCFALTPDVLWQYDYGDSNDQYCRSLIQSNSCFYLIGMDNWDLSLLKVNFDGVVIWNKSFGSSSHDFGESGQVASDGGLILTGWTSSYNDVDLWLLKLDEDGEQEWSATFGDSNEERGFSVIESSAGGYVALGSQLSSNGDQDVFLIKTDSSGNLEWEKTFGGNDSDIGFSVCETTDSGFILTGFTSVENGSCDLWLIKTDSTGNMLWEQKFGGDLEEVGYSVLQTTDGGYIVLGYTHNQMSESDVLLIKTDELGSEQWSTTLGGVDWDRGDCVIQTMYGGYAFTGSMTDANSVNCFVAKVDSYGTLEWESLIGDSDHDEYGYSILQLADGGYAVAGDIRSISTGDYNIFLTRLSAPEGIMDDGIICTSNLSILSVSPNPLSSFTKITVYAPTATTAATSVYDLSGKLVSTFHEEVFERGENTISWNRTDASGNLLPTGIYIIQVQSQDSMSSESVLVLD